ncbi:biotin--[acetyl-CoA-carboxylase] ligase [Salinactinospora qingdaonensis]|uniref:biotin--[biotin carboxyl-carrier protein] ligase n=1 Tax=Salinactinospora qingdaonensis TaxID=702744 RepID=A0ABP7G044_9ACTN
MTEVPGFPTSSASSPYTDLDRPPLRQSALRRALLGAGELWREIEVVDALESTNTELARRAHAGAPEGSVLVAEHQTAGRGRLNRSFQTPPRAALTFSVLVRPGPHPTSYGWLPLLMGSAAVAALDRVAGVRARLKWPNDVLLDERKLAGILSEAVTETGGSVAIVVGMGLNVSQTAEELPSAAATSLAHAEAGCLDRDPLLRAVLRGFAERYGQWQRAGGDAEACGLAAEYRQQCATIGRDVHVHLPDQSLRTGVATDIDAEGRLVLQSHDAHGAGGQIPLTAGDVVHVRPDERTG